MAEKLVLETLSLFFLEVCVLFRQKNAFPKKKRNRKKWPFEVYFLYYQKLVLLYLGLSLKTTKVATVAGIEGVLNVLPPCFDFEAIDNEKGCEKFISKFQRTAHRIVGRRCIFRGCVFFRALKNHPRTPVGRRLLITS